MNKERFKVDYEVGVLDTKTNEIICDTVNAEEVVALLNKLQDTIITLKRRLEKINGGYGHLTHRNGLTANEWVIESQERELRKKNEQISDWIERHSKDIVQIGEQEKTINELKEEMVRLHKMSIELMDRVIPNLRRENERLKSRIAFFEEQEEEFEEYTAQTIQDMIADYRDDNEQSIMKNKNLE